MKTVTFKISEECYKMLLRMSLIFHLKPSLLIQMLIMAVDTYIVQENLDN